MWWRWLEPPKNLKKFEKVTCFEILCEITGSFFNSVEHMTRSVPPRTFLTTMARLLMYRTQTMSKSGWIRVAAGLQKVADAALQQAAGDVGTTAARVAQHGVQMVQSATRAAAPYGYPHAPRSSNVNDDDFSSSAPAPPIPKAPPTSALSLEDHHSAPSPPVTKAPTSAPSLEDHHVEQSPSLTDADSSATSSSTFSSSSPLSDEDTMLASENRIRAATNDEHSTTLGTNHDHLPEGRAVPSTRLGRAMGFASLGVGLAMGTAAEGMSQLVLGTSSSGSSSAVVNDANATRLVGSLRRMRGAALKMGQMLSIQDESLLPPALARALTAVRQGAEAMPQYQLEQQLTSQLGTDWRDKFVHFEVQPFAAASIGQVHRATIAVPQSSINGDVTTTRDIVVKVQYPGVARSIESDLRNLSLLVTWSGLAPKGLFLENIIRVGQEELRVECDYRREMLNQQRIQELVDSDPVLKQNRFVVPHVIDHLTTDQVLTSVYQPGGTIDKVSHLDQDKRNRIGRTILYLTMKELFVWRFMQTDPNWGNFLYDVGSGATSLIDFGAAREYSKDFVDGYLRIVWASAQRDEPTLMEQSHRMNFLTGQENEAMLRAHKLSGFTVGEPFWSDEPFDFRGSNISTRMGEHTAVFLQHRLTPPPEEIYTLHRKLAGAYLLCIKLGAVVRCRDLLEEVVANHMFEDGLGPPRM